MVRKNRHVIFGSPLRWYVAPLTQSYGFLNKQGTASAGSAEAETPILCETCLGPNPYVRMSRQHLGQECKICGRPFTVFRWQPGGGARAKKTEICTTCSKLKHACQSCILDLTYQLPTQVRDAALGTQSKIPMSDINRQYYVNRMDALLDGEAPPGPSRAGHDVLEKLAATAKTPYQRDTPPVCSFYARGACTRGEACPYRHEAPKSAAQRAHEADALAQALQPQPRAQAARLQRAPGAKPLAAPANAAVRTLFFSHLPDMSDDELRALLLGAHPDAPIERVKMVPTSKAAFVVYETRSGAEAAAASLAHKLDLRGHEVRVAWGRT